MKMDKPEDLDEDDADFDDQINLSSDDEHALASIKKEKEINDIRDSEVSEANELKIHESMSCSDLNIGLNSQNPIVTKVEVNEQVVDITTKLFEEPHLRSTLTQCL